MLYMESLGVLELIGFEVDPTGSLCYSKSVRPCLGSSVSKLTPQGRYVIGRAGAHSCIHSFEVDPTGSLCYILRFERSEHDVVSKLTPQGRYVI